MNLVVVFSRLETFSLKTQSNCDTQKAEGFGETGAGVDGEIQVSKAVSHEIFRQDFLPCSLLLLRSPRAIVTQASGVLRDEVKNSYSIQFCL